MFEVLLLAGSSRGERLIRQVYGVLLGRLLPCIYVLSALSLRALQSHLLELLFEVSNIRFKFLVPFFGALETFIHRLDLLVLFGVSHYILGPVVVGFLKLLAKLLNFLFALCLSNLRLIALLGNLTCLLLLFSEQSWVYSLGLGFKLVNK